MQLLPKIVLFLQILEHCLQFDKGEGQQKFGRRRQVLRVRVVEVPLLFLIKGEAAADKWDSIMIRQRRQTMNTHSVFLGSNKLVFCTTTLLFSFFLLNMMIVVGGDQIVYMRHRNELYFWISISCSAKYLKIRKFFCAFFCRGNTQRLLLVIVEI